MTSWSAWLPAILLSAAIWCLLLAALWLVWP
jgi:hypothetical protein